MIGITLLSCYPPGGLQHVCFPQSTCSPGYYNPCGYSSGYGPSCYPPRGYSYISGPSGNCYVPQRYRYLSGWSNTCYDPCGSTYQSPYGGSCYNQCGYSWGHFYRPRRYATRRNYTCLTGGNSCCYNPCGYGDGYQSDYSGRCYNPCGYSSVPICRPPRYAYRRRYTDLSGCGASCYNPCGYGSQYGYGYQSGSCYDPCDYSSGLSCYQPRYPYRRRYSSQPSCSDPCSSDHCYSGSSALCPSSTWKHRSYSNGSKPC